MLLAKAGRAETFMGFLPSLILAQVGSELRAGRESVLCFFNNGQDTNTDPMINPQKGEAGGVLALKTRLILVTLALSLVIQVPYYLI